MSEPTFSATDLHRLRGQLKSWRQRQRGRPHLPASLWPSACALARTHGVSLVARSLGVSFYQVQRLVKESVAPGSSLPAHPSGFVELKLAAPPGSSTSRGTAELVAGPSPRLVIHTGADPAAWVALAEAFWKAHP